jgi:hypothetical protein
MSWIMLIAGYLGGVYMQTWNVYNDPNQCRSAISTEVRKWHSRGAEVDIITCLPIDVKAGPMFKADENGELIPVPPGKSIGGN